MGQIANHMAIELYCKLKKKAKEARLQKQSAKKQNGMKQISL